MVDVLICMLDKTKPTIDTSITTTGFAGLTAPSEQSPLLHVQVSSRNCTARIVWKSSHQWGLNSVFRDGVGNGQKKTRVG